jgi:hypothetical protein
LAELTAGIEMPRASSSARAAVARIVRVLLDLMSPSLGNGRIAGDRRRAR